MFKIIKIATNFRKIVDLMSKSKHGLFVDKMMIRHFVVDKSNHVDDPVESIFQASNSFRRF